MKANTTLNIKSWDEKPYDEFEGGRKLNRADVVFTYTGDLEGEGKVIYLLAYRADGSANFVGMERVTGKLGGREGSFVAQHSGTFEGKVAKTNWMIVPGLGTGGLEKVSGGGDLKAEGEGAQRISFDYE